MHEFPVVSEQEQMALKGGDAPGAWAYYQIYGESLPDNTGYDVNTDTTFNYNESDSSNPQLSEFCQACHNFQEFDNQPSARPIGVTTPLGEWAYGQVVNHSPNCPYNN